MRDTLLWLALLVTVGAGPAPAQLVPLDPERRADGDDGGFALCPQAAGPSNGMFELAWWKREADPTVFTLRSRHFGRQGQPTELQRGLATGPRPERWELTALDAGGFRALWREGTGDGASRPWRTRLLSRFGAPMGGGQLRVSNQVELLSVRPGGGFVGGWRQPRAGWIILQLFDDEGRRVGPERRLNVTRLAVLEPNVVFAHYDDGGMLSFTFGLNELSVDGLAADPDSDRVAVLVRYTDDSCGDPCGYLSAYLLRSDGARVGPPVMVAPTATAPFHSALCGHLTAASPRRWAVSWLAWHLEQNRHAVFVRRLDDVTP